MFNDTDMLGDCSGADMKNLSLDDDIIPKVDLEEIPALVQRLYGIKVRGLKKLPGYYDLNAYFQAEGDIDSVHIASANPDGYVLKVQNSLQSANPQCLEAIHAMMNHVQKRGIVTQTVVLDKEGRQSSMQHFQHRGSYHVRLVTFVPGILFSDTPYVAGSFYNVGKHLGKFHQASEGFHHSFYDNYTFIWSLMEVPRIRDFIHAVKDDKNRAVVEEVIDDFENNVKPQFQNFQKCVCHGDYNEQNLLMRKLPVGDGELDTGVHDVVAILDFTDSALGYFVMDVAICISHMSVDCPDETQLDVSGHILAGYFEFRSLNDAELRSLKTLVCSRLCQILVYGAHAQMQHPENDYLEVITAKRSWPTLHRIWKMDTEELYSKWDKTVKSYGVNK